MAKRHNSPLFFGFFGFYICLSATMAQSATVDWTEFEKYFEIVSKEEGPTEYRDSFGRISTVNAIRVLVEAKSTFDFLMLAFFAHFYDSDGVEIGTPSIVELTNPGSLTNTFTPGIRARARIILPDSLDGVDTIRIFAR